MWGAIISGALSALSNSGKKDEGGSQSYDFGKAAQAATNQPQQTQTQPVMQPTPQPVAQPQPVDNTSAPAITKRGLK